MDSSGLGCTVVGLLVLGPGEAQACSVTPALWSLGASPYWRDMKACTHASSS
jgi:hypothetical protein